MLRSPDYQALLVRACWDLDLRIAPLRLAAGNASPPGAPVLERPPAGAATLHLPGTLPDAARTLMQAAAMHAAAHLRFSPVQLDRSGLKPLQQVLFGLLEDARVETLALRPLPGLRGLWLPFHLREAAQGNTVEALLRRLARALAAPDFPDAHPWIEKARRLFRQALGSSPLDDQLSALRRAASLLGNDLGQMRLQFNAAAHIPFPSYRDDNAHLWRTDGAAPEDAPLIRSDQAQSDGDAADHQALRRHEDAERAASPSARQGQGQGRDAADDRESGAESRLIASVAEWDRLSMCYRAGWCRIYEQAPPRGDPHDLARLLNASGTWRTAAARMLRAAGFRRPASIAGVDGDELVTDPMVASAVALRVRQAPERRVYRCATRRSPVREVALVLDTSVSTGVPVMLNGVTAPVRLLDAMKTAAMLACAALEDAGYSCSLTGFCSNTRHHVRLQPVKAAGESIDSEAVLWRLAGLAPQWSTRTGAALRHLTADIAPAGGRRLVVLLTDGEPHDIDMHDAAYLEDDLRRALREAEARGTGVVGVSLGRTVTAGTGGALPGKRGIRLYRAEDIATVLARAIAAGRFQSG